jgi:hypothetical protein
MELLKTHTKGGPVHLVYAGGCCKLPFTAQAIAALTHRLNKHGGRRGRLPNDD